MGSLLHLFGFILLGIVLIWFGLSFILKKFKLSSGGSGKNKQNRMGEPGNPQVCPVCSSMLNKGERVESRAFPSLSGGKDRLMHVRGCYYCLNGYLPRKCPVCKNVLEDDDFLVSRIFERSLRRSHVHVLGCNRCKKTGSMLR